MDQLQVWWRPTPMTRQLGCLTLPLCLTRCCSTGTTSTLWTLLSTPVALGVPPREIPRKCGPPSSVILRPSAPIDISWTYHHFYNISFSLIDTPISEQQDDYIFIKLFLKLFTFHLNTKNNQKMQRRPFGLTLFFV